MECEQRAIVFVHIYYRCVQFCSMFACMQVKGQARVYVCKRINSYWKFGFMAMAVAMSTMRCPTVIIFRLCGPIIVLFCCFFLNSFACAVSLKYLNLLFAVLNLSVSIQLKFHDTHRLEICPKFKFSIASSVYSNVYVYGWVRNMVDAVYRMDIIANINFKRNLSTNNTFSVKFKYDLLHTNVGLCS